MQCRWIDRNDAEAFFAIRSNREVMLYMGKDPMQSVAEARDFIDAIHASYENQRGLNWGIVDKSSGRFVGYFGYWRIDAQHRRGEIGFALHPDFWGKGYMRETLAAMVRFGFDVLHLHSIEANVDPRNAASVTLLERTGFRKEAYFRENYFYNGEYFDSAIYCLLERDERYRPPRAD